MIEYLARLLLELLEETLTLIPTGEPTSPMQDYIVKGFLPNPELEQTFRDKIIPSLPPNDLGIDLQSIKKYLLTSAQEVGGVSKLLNQYIIFRLSNRLPGGRYPTPRHITTFIYNLAQVEPHHSLADFACGSGGFLVQRELTVDNYDKTWGIDISLSWIRIAWSNIALRQFPPNLRVRNALKISVEEFSTKTFDRILMNPPFGEKIDSELAKENLSKNVGSRSETALTTLAIQKLAENGIAAILVPSGLLFSNSKAEKDLRQTLIDKYNLKAVITLPQDALQPYSSLQSHILLIHKPVDNLSQSILVENDPPQPPLIRGENEKMTWFFQLEEDGYSSGRSRDLTQPSDLSKSDFPFVEGVLNRQGDEFNYSFPESHPQLGVKVIEDNENNFLGFTLRGIETDITSITFYPQANETNPPFLLVETTSLENKKLSIRVPLDGNQPNIVENPSQLIQDLFKPTKNNPEPSIRFYSTAVRSIAIAVSPDTIITKESIRILGVAIQRNQIINNNYDLRPEEYIDKQPEICSSNSPVELLTRIYTNQRQLTQNLETLFSRIELPPISTQKLPSPIVETCTPFGQLNPQQQAVWDKIKSKTQPYLGEEGENYEIALHFTPQEIENSGNGEISDTTQRTLELLEEMGVIIPVTIDDTLYYRRITQRDLWTDLDSNT